MKRRTNSFKAKSFSVVLLSALTACAYGPQKEAIDNRSDEIDKQMISLRANSATSSPVTVSMHHVKGKYVATKSVPLGDEALLPPVFSETIDYSLPGRAPLATIAEQITKITGIPVRLKADITSAPPTPNAITEMEIKYYRGTLTGLLDLIASRFNINWENKTEGIVFHRLLTRSFTVASNGTDTNFAAGLGKTASTGTTGGFSSSGQVNLKADYSLWDGLEKTMQSIKTPEGRYTINRASGIVTVTDTRDVVDMLEKVLTQTNAILTRQVAVRIQMYKVNRSEDRQMGFDWNMVFSKLANLSPHWRIQQITPATLTSMAAGGTGISILAPVTNDSSVTQRLSGSDIMFNAIQAFQNINLVNTVNSVTLNRKAAPAAITTQTGYLARTTPGVAVAGGGTPLPGLEPATVTTGFLTNVIPTIQDDNTVLLEFTLDSSILRELNNVSSGQGPTLQTIQTPLVDGVGMLQSVAIRSGQSLILTGYEREGTEYKQRGLTDHIEAGGSYAGMRGRESVMIVVTPTIVGGGA